MCEGYCGGLPLTHLEPGTRPATQACMCLKLGDPLGLRDSALPTSQDSFVDQRR